MRCFPLEQLFISFLILYVGGLIDAHPVYYNLRCLIYYLISLL